LAAKIGPLAREYSLQDLLKRPELGYADIACLKGEPDANPQVAEQVEILAKYAGYIDRQEEEVIKLRTHAQTALPVDFDYNIDGLSNELRQKLSLNKPDTLARASRIQGMTPAAISLLLITLKKRGLLRASQRQQALSV
jgi:tRNA uridine 5-carboxymethylaminomethyl modification enzyme